MILRFLAPRGPGQPIFAAVLVLACLLAAPLEASAPSPQEFLTGLQETVAKELTGEDIDETTREVRFRELFGNHFDLPTIGRFVLGRYWRGASDEDRQAFLQAFEDVMVQRFLPLLSEESDVRFIFGNVTEDPRNSKMILLASRVPRPGGEPVKVTWRLKKVDESYQILDIITEGVSMAITLRSEYASYVRANGGNVAKLVKSLQEKLARGAFKPRTN